MSEFYIRKMRTFFERLDYDKDGAITQKDFEDIAARFIAKGTLSAEKGVELNTKLGQAWQKYLKDPNSDKPLTKEDCVALFGKQVTDAALRDKLRATIKDLMEIFFNAIDANADGNIQLEEYAVFFEVMAIDRTLATATFQAIDTNGDGELSIDEFAAAGTEFFVGEDASSPTQLFWGPLV